MLLIMLLGKMGNPDDGFVWHKNSAYSKLSFKINGIRWSIRVFKKPHSKLQSWSNIFKKKKNKRRKEIPLKAGPTTEYSLDLHGSSGTA